VKSRFIVTFRKSPCQFYRVGQIPNRQRVWTLCLPENATRFDTHADATRCLIAHGILPGSDFSISVDLFRPHHPERGHSCPQQRSEQSLARL
jgi:hypothetical protein